LATQKGGSGKSTLAAFVLNQTPIHGQRIHHAASALSDGSAVGLTDVLALPFITTRNDHHDALRAGLAVSEYAPSGKSADEIRDLWQWVAARLPGGVLDHQPLASEDATFPALLRQPIAASRS
jgi:chromosome partitioning protein